MSPSASGPVVCASQIRTSIVPKEWCARTDHHSWVNSTIEFVRSSRSTYCCQFAHVSNGSGTPQRGKDLVNVCVRAECRPESAAVDVRRVGADREQQREHGPQAVAGLDRPVAAR